MKRLVKIVEVGPRDGLQSIKKFIKREDKIKYIEKLHEAGLKNIEVGSIVKKVPQMRDTLEILHHFRNYNFNKIVLVPNVFAAESALNHGATFLSVFTSTSEEFCKTNSGCSIKENRNKIKDILGLKVPTRAYISYAFKDYEKTRNMVQDLLELGCCEISLADTDGTASQIDIIRGTSLIKNSGLDINKLALHLHIGNTCGMAKSNLFAGLSQGIRIIDSSTGEIGGCSTLENRSKNISTINVLNILDELGMYKDIDIDKLIHAYEFIQKTIEEI